MPNAFETSSHSTLSDFAFSASFRTFSSSFSLSAISARDFFPASIVALIPASSAFTDVNFSVRESIFFCASFSAFSAPSSRFDSTSRSVFSAFSSSFFLSAIWTAKPSILTAAVFAVSSSDFAFSMLIAFSFAVASFSALASNSSRLGFIGSENANSESSCFSSEIFFSISETWFLFSVIPASRILIEAFASFLFSLSSAIFSAGSFCPQVGQVSLMSAMSRSLNLISFSDLRISFSTAFFSVAKVSIFFLISAIFSSNSDFFCKYSLIFAEFASFIALRFFCSSAITFCKSSYSAITFSFSVRFSAASLLRDISLSMFEISVSSVETSPLSPFSLFRRSFSALNLSCTPLSSSLAFFPLAVIPSSSVCFSFAVFSDSASEVSISFLRLKELSSIWILISESWTFSAFAFMRSFAASENFCR